jgi:hypothetical protein
MWLRLDRVSRVAGRWERFSRRRKVLLISGAATVLLFLVLTIVDRELASVDGGASILDLEWSGSASAADTILLGWGDRGMRLARISLWIDFAFLAFYSTFLAVAAAETKDAMKARDFPSLTLLGYATPAFAIGAGLCDLAENIIWLLVLDGKASNAVATATVFAIMKFSLIGFVLGYLLIGLAARLARAPSVRA